MSVPFKSVFKQQFQNTSNKQKIVNETKLNKPKLNLKVNEPHKKINTNRTIVLQCITIVLAVG